MNKKIGYKRVRPNALFEKWLTNVYEEAKGKNSKITPKIEAALNSLSKYPIPLKSGSECMILQGFGKEMCKFIDLCLERHNSNNASSENSYEDDRQTHNPSPLSSASSTSVNVYLPRNSTSSSIPRICILNPSINNIVQSTSSVDPVDVEIVLPDTNSSNIQMKSVALKYKPAFRSGGYAILHALLDQMVEHKELPSLTKEQLIESAQKYSDESFVRPKPETFYTAWSNMSRLIKKGLVKTIKKKKMTYYLTEEGKNVIQEVILENSNRTTVNDIIFKDLVLPSTSDVNSCQNGSCDMNVAVQSVTRTDDYIEMAPGTFDIVLLIDKNETSGVKKKNDPTVAQFNKFPDLNHEYRSLKVGDFAWVAKHKVNQDQELVLPFVVERKRMDDLGASIKDGRFHEQKFRLRKCGLSNVIYLVENYGKNKNVGLPLQNLMQALANTRVQDSFKVHITDSLTNSVRFLAMMTKRLTIRYKDKNLRGCNSETIGDSLMTYKHFSKSSAKTKPLTVTETFIKLLLQLKGVSVEKALAITQKYPTPRSLIEAYGECNKNEGEWLLANLKYGNLNRSIGPVSSKLIYLVFSNQSV